MFWNETVTLLVVHSESLNIFFWVYRPILLSFSHLWLILKLASKILPPKTITVKLLVQKLLVMVSNGDSNEKPMICWGKAVKNCRKNGSSIQKSWFIGCFSLPSIHGRDWVCFSYWNQKICSFDDLSIKMDEFTVIFKCLTLFSPKKWVALSDGMFNYFFQFHFFLFFCFVRCNWELIWVVFFLCFLLSWLTEFIV